MKYTDYKEIWKKAKGLNKVAYFQIVPIYWVIIYGYYFLSMV